MLATSHNILSKIIKFNIEKIGPEIEKHEYFPER